MTHAPDNQQDIRAVAWSPPLIAPTATPPKGSHLMSIQPVLPNPVSTVATAPHVHAARASIGDLLR